MNYLWLVNVLYCNTSAFSCIFDRTEEDEDKEEDKDKEEEDKEARSLSLSTKQRAFFSFVQKKNKKLCLGFCTEFINPKQKNFETMVSFHSHYYTFIYINESITALCVYTQNSSE